MKTRLEKLGDKPRVMSLQTNSHADSSLSLLSKILQMALVMVISSADCFLGNDETIVVHTKAQL